jgi:hypothetical protein
MMPTVPFIYLMIAFAVSSLFDHLQTKKTIISFLIGSLIFINTIFAFSYFVTAFIREDSRINAYQFALRKIPYESKILSEIYDMGIVPFNSSYHNITLFHFYDLDNNSLEATPESLKDKLDDNDFIILPSQRLLKTRLLQKEKFPFGYSFYKSLQTETTGYSKIYETPCDIFCQITYLGDPVFRFEQTANVFDRPTVMIFQKNKN